MDDRSNSVGAGIKSPPVGFAVLALVGPSMVWAAEYIGYGEVILATRTGTILVLAYFCVVQMPVVLFGE